MGSTITELKYILKGLTQEEYEQQAAITDYRKSKVAAARLKIQGLTQQIINETKKNNAANSIAIRIAEEPKISKKIELIDELAEIYVEMPRHSIAYLPHDIKAEIEADLEEVQQCIENNCLRSAIILCGRVLETALHRKYYDVTGVDLLEKAPGTGLGNMIAKLSERGVKLDPGLTNQIHLVNQVRVHSVHKKQQPFIPTKQQTQAIVLYTQDILEKLFRK